MSHQFDWYPYPWQIFITRSIMTKFGFDSKFECAIEHPKPDTKLKLGGWFDVECYNEDGTIAWREKLCMNGVNNAALNDVLSVYLNSGTQKTTWYLGLIDGTGSPALAAADIISSHAGWTENVTYSESVRQTWTPSAASGQSITNPTSASFTINGTTTVYGAFLVSNSTKSGTTGTLWATGAFSSVQSLSSSQVLKVTYTCAAASS